MTDTEAVFGLPGSNPAFYEISWRYASEDGSYPVITHHRAMFIAEQEWSGDFNEGYYQELASIWYN